VANSVIMPGIDDQSRRDQGHGFTVASGFSLGFVDASRAGESAGAASAAAPGGGPYILRRLIGEGGQGEVWEAWQTSLGREVAVKRVSGSRWDELIRRERAGDAPAHDYLARHLAILRGVCHAVAYAHTRGIVHLDLKPSQVIVGEFGEVFLMDWGIAARLVPAPGRGRAVADIRGPLGTPGYMAPEQATGDSGAIGVATDVYLLGATAYHIATGRAPHAGDNLAGTMDNARLNRVAPLGNAVPPRLALIVERAMAHSPAARFASAEEFRLAVEAFLGEASHEREAHAIMAECEARCSAIPACGCTNSSRPRGASRGRHTTRPE